MNLYSSKGGRIPSEMQRLEYTLTNQRSEHIFYPPDVRMHLWTLGIHPWPSREVQKWTEKIFLFGSSGHLITKKEKYFFWRNLGEKPFIPCHEKVLV